MRRSFLRNTAVCLSLSLSMIVSACGASPTAIQSGPAEMVDLSHWGRGQVLVVAFSPSLLHDMALLAVASSTGTYIYEADTWTEVKHLDTPASVQSIAWHPNKEQLALVGWEETQIWDVEESHILCTLPVGGSGAAWSPDGEWLAIGSQRGLQVWNTDSRTLIYSFEDILSTGMSWSRDGQLLAAGDVQGVVYLISIPGGDFRATLDLRVRALQGMFTIYSLAWHPHGDVLAIGGSAANQVDGVVLWEPAQGSTRLLHPPGIGIPIRSAEGMSQLDFDVGGLAWSPDGRMLAIDAGWKYLWDSGKDAWYDLGTEELGDLLGLYPSSLSWEPRGAFVASSGIGGRRVSIWNASEASLHPWHAPSDVEELEGTRSALVSSRIHVIDLGYPLDAEYCAWSPDSELLAIAENRGKVSLWDRGGRQIQVLAEGDPRCFGRVRPVWSPSGQQLAYHLACSGDQSDQIRIWAQGQAGLGQQVLEYGARFASSPAGLAWSPDGAVLTALTVQGDVVLWDTQTWRERGVLSLPNETPAPLSLCLTFAEDGSLTVGYSDGTIRAWDMWTQQVMYVLQGKTAEPVFKVLWSPDGKSLASSVAGAVIIWGVDGHALPHVATRLRSGSPFDSDFVWSPDGQKLAVLDGRLLTLWNTRDWTEASNWEVCPWFGGIRVDWSADGQRLAVICEDGTVQVWGIP